MARFPPPSVILEQGQKGLRSLPGIITHLRYLDAITFLIKTIQKEPNPDKLSSKWRRPAHTDLL